MSPAEPSTSSPSTPPGPADLEPEDISEFLEERRLTLPADFLPTFEDEEDEEDVYADIRHAQAASDDDQTAASRRTQAAGRAQNDAGRNVPHTAKRAPAAGLQASEPSSSKTVTREGTMSAKREKNSDKQHTEPPAAKQRPPNNHRGPQTTTSNDPNNSQRPTFGRTAPTMSDVLPDSASASASASASTSTPTRGRGKSRGGLGKYLRARGRGRGRGRPAEWGTRLLLDGEQPEEMDEEAAAAFEQKYSRRQLGSNADRYAEPEPELDADGNAVVESEVDLSEFLERVRRSAGSSLIPTSLSDEGEDADVDQSLAHVSSRPGMSTVQQSKKGRVQEIPWDESLEQLRRDTAAADAARDLKARFRAQAGKPAVRGGASPKRGKSDKSYAEAPPLPTEKPPEKDGKDQMQGFLDDLLS